jgi:hypothetical protein
MPGIDEHRFRSVRFFKDPETRVWKRFEPWMSTIVDPDTGQVLGGGTLTTFCSLSKVTVFEMRKLYALLKS